MLDVLEGLGAEEAPPTLRDRVLGRFQAAPSEDLRRGPRGRLALTAAVLVLLVSVPLLGRALQRGSPAEGTVEAFAADYVRRTAAEEQIRSEDEGEIAAFIQAELGRPIQPVKRRGYRILGAEICLLAGRRGVMLDYDAIEGALSHYIIPTATPMSPSLPRLVATEEVSTGMPHVVRWTDEFGEHALVGHGDPGELLGFARQAFGF